MRKYIVGTGYFKADQKCENFFTTYWLPNTLAGCSPQKIVVTNANSPQIETDDSVEWINLVDNPGHAKYMSENVKFAGWSLGFIHGALYAYSCKCDYIYKEQDCLAFGPWINRMYEACEGYQMVTGTLWNHPRKAYLIELSLQLLKYEFIMPFLAKLFSIPKGEMRMRPEEKFLVAAESIPNSLTHFKFGYGGNRPFNPDDECFYIQKPRWNYKDAKRIKTEVGSGITLSEIKTLENKGLL